ncbi:L,D-transpeptidase [Thiobaca trueperi]|nr:L,D-transpeptidase [Thiobaca trueperi]
MTSLTRSLCSMLVASTVLAGCAHAPSQRAPERLPVAEQAVPETTPAPLVETAQTAPSNDSRVAPSKRSLTISLGAQQFAYAEDGQVVRTGPISSGAAGSPTPTGRFAVLSKDRDKVSSRYTNQLGWQAWMPYSIQFNGHYFLHEGWLPGYPDSHGCVRVGEPDARFLFERLKIGDRVDVVASF